MSTNQPQEEIVNGVRIIDHDRWSRLSSDQRRGGLTIVVSPTQKLDPCDQAWRARNWPEGQQMAQQIVSST